MKTKIPVEMLSTSLIIQVVKCPRAANETISMIQVTPDSTTNENTTSILKFTEWH